ncbi:GNAT family N-acetyltransferase [Rhizobium sp. L1K21]|uniref:GNAT family N-acetyltransferase n=1 Tax=Rhizobium sp. L1K21 TaxID=2954933 RepID=UPI0020928B41|nr:N-acetyltransferase [Rhizobium sp. L1K21]MCO6185514.1 N-acetyltransferase [Rhizobium sp. L1K21]
MASFVIRNEKPGDEEAIFILTQTAFETMPYSDGSEGFIVNRLRADGDLAYSLVAIAGQDAGEAIIGHVAFSPVTVGSSEGWFGLGPISVAPNMQRKGVGKALIAQGLDRLRAAGGKGCVLVGDPGYYARHGFVSNGKLTYADIDQAFIQYIAFTDDEPEGEIHYAAAFGEAG